MLLSQLEKYISELRLREGDLKVSACVVGVGGAEHEEMTNEMISIVDPKQYGPYPGERHVQIG